MTKRSMWLGLKFGVVVVVENKMAVRVVMLWAIMTMIIHSVKQGVALRSTHPLRGVVDDVNDEGGPYIGLVMAYPTEEAVLLESGLFIPSSYIPSIQFTGRSFNIGTIRGVDVIYVMTGEQTVNAGVTVQILLDLFDIVGVVHYGVAGSTNDSLLIGDVSVPSYLAFTDSWEWTETGSEDDGKDLKFWEFNDPKEGGNLLGRVIFTPTQLFSDGDDEEQDVFWMPVDAYWFHISTQIQGVNLTRCMNETECVPNEPKIVYGVRGSTASVFLNNAAYRKFLYNEFNVSTVDEESAAVVMTSLSNGVPCIVFRAITDMAGAILHHQPPTNNLRRWSSWSYAAAANALNVAVEFIELIAGGAGAAGGGAGGAGAGGGYNYDATTYS